MPTSNTSENGSIDRLVQEAARYSNLPLRCLEEDLTSKLCGLFDPALRFAAASLRIPPSSPFTLDILQDCAHVCRSSMPHFDTAFQCTAQSWLSGIKQMSEHLEASRESLADYFSLNSEASISSFTSLTPESHYRGNCVRKLVWADGRRLIYKPGHRQSTDILLQLGKIINRQECTVRLDWLTRPLTRRDHAFERFLDISESECDHADTDLRLAEILAFSLFFRGCDLHHENFIVSTKGLILLDTESFFHPVKLRPAKQHANSQAEHFRQNGLFRTIIDIPCYEKQDISLTRQLLETRGYVPDADAITSHFQTTCAAILATRSALAGALRHACHNASGDRILTRATLRPTFFYGMLQQYAYSPGTLADIPPEAAFRKHLECTPLYGTTPASPAVVNEEVAALVRGDVPAFHACPDAVSLHSSNNLIDSDFFVESALHHIEMMLEEQPEQSIQDAMSHIKEHCSHREPCASRHLAIQKIG
ncbi:MAG: DUF4135 domain-containing protein [Alcanivorax sp.]|nr:DUF4135 domain-containing protein [Alcanivorax sp.]